jgi:putative membrane protein insertion efficiency factor
MASRVARALALSLVHGYRTLISPVRGPCCRFTPTCSAYAIEAVERHGAWRGSLLALLRILRCHPFAAAGIDPVPATHPHTAPTKVT